ncbi:MAG: transcriptional repressor [Tissierellia bacterium]|nr:transcriptional repressor [Tissierellia bacterium]
MYSNLLKEKNIKITKNRILLLETIEKLNKVFNVDDIYESLKNNNHKINISTIYRNVNTFYENDILDKITEVNGIIYYQLQKETHLHYLICTQCNQIIPLKECPLEEIENNLSKKTGYTIESHNLEFRGICPKCNKNKKDI